MITTETKEKDYEFIAQLELDSPFSTSTTNSLLLGINTTSQGKKAWIGAENARNAIANYITLEQLDEIIIVLMYMKKELEE